MGESSDSPPDTSDITTGSLAILLQDREFRQKDKARYRSANTIWLETIAGRNIELIATHQFDHPGIAETLVDDYHAYLEYQTEKPIITSREAFVDGYKAFAAKYPGYKLKLEDIHAAVNEKNGTAAVWMLLTVTGHPEGLVRESVTLQFWKRSQGKWRAYKQTGIRGVGGYI